MVGEFEKGVKNIIVHLIYSQNDVTQNSL